MTVPDALNLLAVQGTTSRPVVQNLAGYVSLLRSCFIISWITLSEVNVERKIVVSSLQLENQTCFHFSSLYQRFIKA